jgi:nitrate reductase delta subunit
MRAALEAASALLRYPGPDHAARVAACLAEVPPALGEARAALEAFDAAIRGLPTEALQELYTRTFDLNPACSPELGWHLFGERYERGLFLVKLRQLMRRVELPETTELPDHLAGVLRLLPRLPAEEAADLAAACVLPALATMRGTLAGKGQRGDAPAGAPPYLALLDLAARLVEASCGLPRTSAAAPPALRVVEDGPDELDERTAP